MKPSERLMDAHVRTERYRSRIEEEVGEDNAFKLFESPWLMQALSRDADAGNAYALEVVEVVCEAADLIEASSQMLDEMEAN